MVERLYLLLEIIAILICASNIFGEKFKVDILTAVYIFVNILAIRILSLIGLFNSYGYILYLFLLFYCILEFRPSILEGIFRYGILFLFCITMQLLCSIPFLLLSTYITGKLVYLYTNILFLISCVVLNCTVSIDTIIRRTLNRYRMEKGIILLAGLGVGAGMVVNFRSLGRFSITNYCIFLFFMIIVVFLFLCWITINNKLKQMEKEKQLAVMYNGTFQNLIETMRMEQHDFKNHLQALLSIAEAERDAEEIRILQRTYCSDAIGILKRSNVLYSVNTPPLTAFLYTKMEEARRKEIITEHRFAVQQCQIGIPIYQIVEIVGILLDNAYEAVEEMPKEQRRVNIQLIETEGCLYLEICNPTILTLQEYLKLNESGKSTKGENRGMGLAKIADYCRRYRLKRTVDIESQGNEKWLKVGMELKG